MADSLAVLGCAAAAGVVPLHCASEGSAPADESAGPAAPNAVPACDEKPFMGDAAAVLSWSGCAGSGYTQVPGDRGSDIIRACRRTRPDRPDRHCINQSCERQLARLFRQK